MSVVTVYLKEAPGVFTSNGQPEGDIILANFSVRGPDGTLEEKTFFDQYGDKSTGLILKHGIQFNTDNRFEKLNLDLLKVYLQSHPEFSDEIIIEDPDLIEREEYERSTRVFETESLLRNCAGNDQLIARIYRRVLNGVVTGKKSTTLLNDLIAKARQDPDAFYKNGKFISNDPMFETYALMDAAIEKGLLQRDYTGAIKRPDGHIFAENAETAVFALSQNDELRTLLRVQLEDQKSPIDYIPDINNTGMVDVKDEVAEILRQEAKEVSDHMTEEAIEENIKRFIKAGFILVEGKGAGTKYRFADSSPKTGWKTRAKIVAELRKNRIRYEEFLDILKQKA